MNQESGQNQADFKIVCLEVYGTTREPKTRSFEVICRVLGFESDKVKEMKIGDTVILDGKMRSNSELRVNWVEAWRVC